MGIYKLVETWALGVPTNGCWLAWIPVRPHLADQHLPTCKLAQLHGPGHQFLFRIMGQAHLWGTAVLVQSVLCWPFALSTGFTGFASALTALSPPIPVDRRVVDCWFVIGRIRRIPLCLWRSGCTEREISAKWESSLGGTARFY